MSEFTNTEFLRVCSSVDLLIFGTIIDHCVSIPLTLSLQDDSLSNSGYSLTSSKNNAITIKDITDDEVNSNPTVSFNFFTSLGQTPSHYIVNYLIVCKAGIRFVFSMVR